MKLNRVATGSDKHDLGDACRIRQFAVAEVESTGFHGVDLDVAIDPVGSNTFEIAKLDILAGDVAANAFTDRAVG